jgi:hypothetical protein
MPRPTKLTAPVAEKIALAIKGCASYKAAAEHAGVSRASFNAWMARGRSELSRLEAATDALEALPKRARSAAARKARMAAQRAAQPHPDELRYLDFLDTITQADAQAQVRAAAQIAAAGADEWRANAWLLERRDPETFGPPQARVALEGSETGAPLVSIVAVDAQDPETRRLAHELLARAAGRAQPD